MEVNQVQKSTSAKEYGIWGGIHKITPLECVWHNDSSAIIIAELESVPHNKEGGIQKEPYTCKSKMFIRRTQLSELTVGVQYDASITFKQDKRDASDGGFLVDCWIRF